MGRPTGPISLASEADFLQDIPWYNRKYNYNDHMIDIYSNHYIEMVLSCQANIEKKKK